MRGLLHDKIVVITGAGRGIGRALSIGFCKDGAHVVGFSRTKEDLVATSQHCGGGMSHVVGDVASAEDVERLFSKGVDPRGRIDILVNCAGEFPKREFLELPLEQWIHAINTNLLGLALCCRAALPRMIDNGYGRIITLSSRLAASPRPGSSAYSASKAGASLLTRTLACEVRAQSRADVLINDLIPGPTKTGMCSWGQEPFKVYPHARFLATLPSGGPSGKTFFRSRPYELHNKWGQGWLRGFLHKWLGGQICL